MSICHFYSPINTKKLALTHKKLAYCTLFATPLFATRAVMYTLFRSLPKSYVNQTITALLDASFLAKKHGDFSYWCARLDDLPRLVPMHIDLADVITIGTKQDAGAHHSSIYQCVKDLIPWRKGPFSLFGVDVDAEWRSEQKWHRLAPHLHCADAAVLDVGANNGYYMFRLAQAGATYVLGLDTQLKAVVQFYLLQRYANLPNVALVPLRLEAIADNNTWRNQFDIVLALGTLYHARNPILHLMQLRDRLKKGGTLFVETLVVDNATNTLITPKTTYMRMSNVWFVTSIDLVYIWLERLQFKNIKLLDMTQTETSEQRQTDWMPFASLADGLHPSDSQRTAEQLPRAKRALLCATK